MVDPTFKKSAPQREKTVQSIPILLPAREEFVPGFEQKSYCQFVPWEDKRRAHLGKNGD
jgi:hypothetical protein